MNKFMCGVVLSMCTMPALAAGAGHPLQSLLGGANAGARAGAAKTPDLPLPPANLTGALTVPGFGKASEPALKPVELPGLGDLSFAYKNPGQDNGPAKLSQTLRIDPQSTDKPTGLTGDLQFGQKNPLIAAGSLSGKGYGQPSQQARTLDLPLGKIESGVTNGGAGKNLDAALKYTSPAPKQ